MPRLTDEQQAAANSIETNVLVSAGAGSGKTMVLVERYLEVLRRNPEASVNDIVAVTFTRKAAEEMRSRLKARLREITAEVTEDDDRKRWSKLLADVDRARIGTIHSLCESTLRAFPSEAAVDPQFEILDDLVRARLIHDCVEESLQGLIGEPNEDALVLLEFPIESIRKMVLGRLDQIPQYREARMLLGPDAVRLEEQARAVIQHVRIQSLQGLYAEGLIGGCLNFLRDNQWPDPENKLEIVRSQIADALDQLWNLRSALCSPDAAATQEPTANERQANNAIELIALIAETPSPGTSGGPKGKPLRGIISEIRSRCKKFIEACPAALNDSDQQAFSVLRALIGLIDKSVDLYETRKLDLQRLDYNDLIVKTHTLLCTPGSNARKHMAEKLRAVLVDEFQDTNFTQAQLLSSICGEKARLFLIGDDKQSIYKFQGADVSTFNEWKRLISTGTHGLAGDSMQLDLSFSFRSHPSIVDFVNRFFKFYFHSDPSTPQAPHKAQHRALVASRTDEHEPARVEVIVYDAVEGDEKRQIEKSRAVESQAIAAWILEKIGNGATIFDKDKKEERLMSFGDFAVLVQANGDFSPIEAALTEANIPYVTYAGSGFLNRQEVLDLENMLRWLGCALDDHALIAVLRSPFYGLNDGLIHRVYSEGQGNLWQSLQRAAKSEEFPNLPAVVQSLKQLHTLQDQMSLSDLLTTIVLSTGYDVVTLSLPNGKQKSRNIWKFISFAKEHNQLPLSEFLAAMAAMRELGVGKQTDAPLNAEDSVRLMTIHKSKGLEFPAVILPVLGKKVHLFTPKFLMHREFGFAYDTTRAKEDLKPAFFKAALTVNNEFEAEEKKRLLYVGMTRARDYMAMFIERNTRNETSFRWWVKQALALDADESGDSEPLRKADLEASEHYQARFFDDQGVAEWASNGKVLAGKYMKVSDVEQLSEEIGFDLLAPLSGQFTGEVPPKRIHWHQAERVTLSAKQSNLHPTVVGNLFHAVMQHIVNSNSIADRDTIARLATTHGINAIEPNMRDLLIERVLKFINVYETSQLREILSTSSRVMSEINYTVVALHGGADKRPDLILQDARGQWQIIDFKTDYLVPTDIAAKVNQHSSQLMQYVKDFESITGLRATGWLYFAELGKLEEVSTQSYSVGKKGQLQLNLPS